MRIMLIDLSQSWNSGIRGFGVSFSRAVDLDGNRIADTAVGAEGAAVVLRGRPLVRHKGSISFSPAHLTSSFVSNFSMEVGL